MLMSLAKRDLKDLLNRVLTLAHVQFFKSLNRALGFKKSLLCDTEAEGAGRRPL